MNTVMVKMGVTKLNKVYLGGIIGIYKSDVSKIQTKKRYIWFFGKKTWTLILIYII
jgi:hypothetical protein